MTQEETLQQILVELARIGDRVAIIEERLGIIEDSVAKNTEALEELNRILTLLAGQDVRQQAKIGRLEERVAVLELREAA